MKTLTRKLAVIKGSLSPIHQAASRYLKEESDITENGVMQIARRPWVAPENYTFWLYPGIDDESLNRYCQTFQIEIPLLYRRFLKKLNGAYCFGMSFYGVPLSMLGYPPMLNRSIVQCLDLGMAGTWWSREYRNSSGRFHFGGRHFSYRENIGYFIEGKTTVLSLKKTGQVINQWKNFKDFLTDELKASERLEMKLHPRK